MPRLYDGRKHANRLGAPCVGCGAAKSISDAGGRIKVAVRAGYAAAAPEGAQRCARRLSGRRHVANLVAAHAASWTPLALSYQGLVGSKCRTRLSIYPNGS